MAPAPSVSATAEIVVGWRLRAIAVMPGRDVMNQALFTKELTVNMRIILSFIAVAFLLVAPASASETSDAFACVQQFVDAFNKNDSPGMVGRVTTTLDIIDDLPPYHWSGPTALQDWGRDVDAYIKAESVTEPFVKLSQPTYVGVVGANGYVVVPAVYSHKQQDQRVQQNGIITASLRKNDQGWRVTSFAWTRQ